MNYELLHPGSKTKNPPKPGNQNRMEQICANCGQRYGAHYGNGETSMCPVLNLSSGTFSYPSIDNKIIHDMVFKEGGTINLVEVPKIKPTYLDDSLFEID